MEDTIKKPKQTNDEKKTAKLKSPANIILKKYSVKDIVTKQFKI